jgi:hypothetical protein
VPARAQELEDRADGQRRPSRLEKRVRRQDENSHATGPGTMRSTTRLTSSLSDTSRTAATEAGAVIVSHVGPVSTPRGSRQKPRLDRRSRFPWRTS